MSSSGSPGQVGMPRSFQQLPQVGRDANIPPPPPWPQATGYFIDQLTVTSRLNVGNDPTAQYWLAIPGATIPPATGWTGVNPVINFDATDYLYYDRPTNFFSMVINGAPVATFAPGLMTVPGNLTIGGNLTVSNINYTPQPAGWVLAGPVTAPNATPVFRALVNSDLPQALSVASLTTSGNVTVGGQTPHGVLLGNAPITSIAVGGANQALMGNAGADPAFRALIGADLPNPSTTTLGGIQAINALANNWIRSISAAGVPALSQPATTNLSDLTASTIFTPSFTCTTPGDLTLGSTTFSGRYMKLGAIGIFFFTAVFTPTWTTASGAAQITGIPISPSSGINGWPVLITQFYVTTWQGASQQIAATFVSAGTLQFVGLKPGNNSSVFQIASFPSGTAALITGMGVVF